MLVDLLSDLRINLPDVLCVDLVVDLLDGLLAALLIDLLVALLLNPLVYLLIAVTGGNGSSLSEARGLFGGHGGFPQSAPHDTVFSPHPIQPATSQGKPNSSCQSISADVSLAF